MYCYNRELKLTGTSYLWRKKFIFELIVELYDLSKKTE